MEAFCTAVTLQKASSGKKGYGLGRGQGVTILRMELFTYETLSEVTESLMI